MRKPPFPQQPSWDHAVVVGGGFGGLLAAQVLAEFFSRVTILERDFVTKDTYYHAGVPQARHTHTLLARGAVALEELLPGLRAELLSLGAPVFDLGQGFALRFPTGWSPRGYTGIETQTFSRALLERCIRRRILTHPAITLHGGFHVERIQFNTAGTDAIGIQGYHHKVDESHEEANRATSITADLIVVATGRTSHLSKWLEQGGFSSPRERSVHGNTSYTSRMYHGDPGWAGTFGEGISSLGEFPYAPNTPRGGGLVAIENGQYIVSLVGAAGQSAPTDESGFIAYACQLRNATIARALTTASPDISTGSIYRFSGLGNRWTAFHRMPNWPDRLLALGDAVCTLNPMYGQGMTLVGTQALVLRDLLRQYQRNTGQLQGIARRFQKRIAKSMRLPWLMATSADLAWTPNAAPLSARLSHWYLNKLIKLLPSDFDIYRRFFATAQMLNSPAALMHPRILCKIFVETVRARCGKNSPARSRQNSHEHYTNSP
ncbi:FAD-dependent oxidoreductase [Streptomyces sp. NPDC060085]|uniref:FAD-dependent oxidoreductase n=1 Tax=Streptomyces sp. NPDC060085 TaxID=3347054 RepID=UPI00365ECFB2